MPTIEEEIEKEIEAILESKNYELIVPLIKDTKTRSRVISVIMNPENISKYIPLVDSLMSFKRSPVAIRLIAIEAEKQWQDKKAGKKNGSDAWKNWLLDNTANYVDTNGDRLLIEEPGDRDLMGQS